jgi:hypothetical protein
MTLVYENAFNSDFSTVRNLQALGAFPNGVDSPEGIDGRIEIVDGVYRAHIDETDPPTVGGIRAECAFEVNALGEELWASFEILVKRSEFADDEFIGIFQFHPGDTSPGPVDYHAILRYGSLRFQLSPEHAGVNDKLLPWEFDRWVHVCMHYLPADDASGVFELYLDRVRVYTLLATDTAHSTDTPYLKLGLYDTQHGAAFGTRTAYYRNLKLYKGAESFPTVLGGYPAIKGIVTDLGTTPPPGKVWRGMGQAMRTVQGNWGTTNRSAVYRMPVYSPVPFRRYRLIYPTFFTTTTGSPNLTDGLLSGIQSFIRYTAGFEYPFTQAFTGLAARQVVRFNGGSDHADYSKSTWDANFGYIISDIMDAGQTIPARTAFGIWTGCELGAGPYSDSLPYSKSFFDLTSERYIGADVSTGQITIAGGQATNWAHSNTTITGNPGKLMTPLAMLIEVDDTTECAIIIGDSQGYGLNEGNMTTPEVEGDRYGDPFGNMGTYDRGMWANYPLRLFVNLSQPGDGAKYHVTDDHLKYRLQIAALCNPTHFIDGLGFNEFSDFTQVGLWAASTAYIKGDTVLTPLTGFPNATTGGAIYVCQQAGNSASSGIGPRGGGRGIADNTCVWDFVSRDQTPESLRVWKQLGRKIEIHNKIRAQVLGAKRYVICVGPGATLGASGGADPATQQTPLQGWGEVGCRRSIYNHYVRTGLPVVEPNGFFDWTQRVEYLPDPLYETGCWDHNGVSYRYVGLDNIHPNSHGYATMAKDVIFKDET